MPLVYRGVVARFGTRAAEKKFHRSLCSHKLRKFSLLRTLHAHTPVEEKSSKISRQRIFPPFPRLSSLEGGGGKVRGTFAKSPSFPSFPSFPLCAAVCEHELRSSLLSLPLTSPRGLSPGARKSAMFAT